MKSSLTDVLESELSILPIDLCLKELQQHEVVKLLIKEDDYIQSNMVGRNMTQNGESFWELKISYQANLAIFITDQKMLCRPITFPKGNSSYPWDIPHTKFLANSSRNKALVVSSIREYQQYETLHQLHLGHWYQQNHDSFYRWINSIRSSLTWIWCDHQKARSK